MMNAKDQMLYNIAKEQEDRILSGEDIDLQELADIIKLIRRAEYKRGKSDKGKDGY